MNEKWIVPCNLKYFDIRKHFETNNIVVWRNSFTIKAGDWVYIYLSAPVSAIKYRCRVITDIVTDEIINENQYAIPMKESHNYYSKTTKYIVMELDKEYPNGLYSLKVLRQHGLGQVQIQARANRILSKYIDEIDHQIEAFN